MVRFTILSRLLISALFTHYLLNQLLDFDQHFNDKVLGGWKELIKLNDIDLNFKALLSTLDLLDFEKKIGLSHFIFFYRKRHFS